MKKLTLPLTSLLTITLLLGAPQNSRAQSEVIEIVKPGGAILPIPITLDGFTGEVQSTLKFDLEIAGFEIVSAEKAQYLINGSNAAQVECRVTDRISKASLLAKAFTGSAPRYLAHTLADEIVLTLTRKPGVARTKIAFKRDTGKNSEIYLSDYDGHNAIAVTEDNTIVAAPCWVPGQFKLYYTSYKGAMEYARVYAHDLKSGVRQMIAGHSGMNSSASVSPDGTRIALILSKSGSPDVWVCDADGKNLKQLTTTKEEESSPCWSPDGRTICFSSRASGISALYTVPADGGKMSKLMTAGVANATEPDWSPDGKQIVFTTQRGGFEICVVPAGGGEAKTLVAGEDPSWAANSRTVVFARRKNHVRTLSLLDVPTKRVKDIGQNLGGCSQPCWAR